MANSPNSGTNYRLAHNNKRPKNNPPGVAAILNNKSRDAFLPRKTLVPDFPIFIDQLPPKKIAIIILILYELHEQNSIRL